MKTTDSTPQIRKEDSNKVFWKRVDFWMILLLLAVAAAFYRDSWQEIREGIRQITFRQLLNCILFSLASYCLEGMTIACMMSMAGTGSKSAFSVKRGTAIAYLCEFYRLITLGSGAGFAEIYYLHKSGIETGTATVLTMFQYVCKRIAVLLLGGAGFAALCAGCRMPACRGLVQEYAMFMAAGCALSVGVIVAFTGVAVSDKIAGAILKFLDWTGVKVPSLEKKVCGWREQIILLNRSSRDILRQKRTIARVILLQIGKLLLFYCIPAYLLSSKLEKCDIVVDAVRQGFFTDETSTGWAVCILLMAVVYMLSGVIPAPSGAGSLEFVFLIFFSRFVETQAAIPAVLVFRFATWVVPFVTGSIVYLYRP